MWIDAEVDKMVKKVEIIMAQGKDEKTAIAVVVANWRIPFKVFIPAYMRVYGHVPEEYKKYLDPNCSFFG